MSSNQKIAPKVTADLSSSVVEPTCLSITSFAGYFGGVIVTARIRAKINPTIRIGIQATPIISGPNGAIHNLATQPARKMITKNTQKVPLGPLFLNQNLSAAVTNTAIINMIISSTKVIGKSFITVGKILANIVLVHFYYYSKV
jgi:hypothetical protein